jgi:hypothetical protein
MSYQAGVDALRGVRSAGRLPVMEHPRGISRAAITHFTGIDPLIEPHRLNEAFRKLAEVFEIDLLWGGGLPDDPTSIIDWTDGQTVKQNRAGLDCVQWGIFGTVHQEDGRHFNHIPKPASVDEALALEPLELFPETVEQYHERFTRSYQQMLASVGDVACPVPHHYTTAFHWCLGILGFELFCMVGMEEQRFAALMDKFAQVTRRITTAWSRVDGVQAFICHDDLTMTSGPVFPPDWYRRFIFPHYRSIFAPLREAGIPVIFTSDGDCSVFVDDIFDAGADGLNFEYLVDLPPLVERHADKILIGNMNSATIARGTKQQIADEVERCLAAGSRAPRFVVNIGGQLTHDVPVDNLEYYLNVRKRLSRAHAKASSAAGAR